MCFTFSSFVECSFSVGQLFFNPPHSMSVLLITHDHYIAEGVQGNWRELNRTMLVLFVDFFLFRVELREENLFSKQELGQELTMFDHSWKKTRWEEEGRVSPVDPTFVSTSLLSPTHVYSSYRTQRRGSFLSNN